ncbi:MAG TPA: SPOR domain-containing protein [Bacteroidales bacterium]|nr:SPOR domain-containing protein [Bacteroidales bacterium]HPI87295.1 SPOR domain-containing protein [Bacteroidales bacterium]HPM92864.1 SPOR domain-containing protein [Bacteroidales bacterium]
MKRAVVILNILLIINGFNLFAQLPDFCLTRDEYRLYSLINAYRTKNGQNVIPVSRSLCYVAKIHARDLYINNPDTGNCSLNSWSDQGNWTACCHSARTPNPVCIVNKPKELARYAGEGHELAYWDSQDLHADTVLKFWQSYEQSKELLLNQKKWSHFNWKAIGVGMYKGYACVWVGEARDTLPEPGLCPDDVDALTLPSGKIYKEVITSHTGRYYIIFGSFMTQEDAMKTADKYRKEGLKEAKVLISGKTYRVSLADYPSQQDAVNAKKMLGERFKEAWITKY